MPRESGARFKRSAGHFETTALRFLCCECQLVLDRAEAGHHHLRGGVYGAQLV